MRVWILAVALALSSSLAVAGDEKLTGADVLALLGGNTAIGDWRGTPYKQFFAEGGSTSYVEEGAPPSPGRWKSDPETGNYCSWWERGGWSCYGIEREGDGYVWVVPGGDGYRGPFKVVPGHQL